MDTVNTIRELRARTAGWRDRGERIAFVPTMGNLHAGHLRLVRHARTVADRVVVSIFVNPTQFGPGEDYATYPRSLEADRQALMDADADLLFAPAVEEVYTGDLENATRVEVPGLSDILCGAFRPGFFSGIATVVTRLFNMVQPQVAVFGEKDYQQLVMIRRMVRDLCLRVEVEGVATERESDGLAMSSRNAYLGTAERQLAPGLYRALCEVRDAVASGAQDYHRLEQTAMEALSVAGFKPDYVSIRRQADLALPGTGDTALIVLAAATLGSARLIDNVQISVTWE
jgi:pantoate--beta-alanine ligase